MAASSKVRPAALRRLIDVAMEFERRTMYLYCAFESQFSEVDELRGFWFDMAQHESRHFGALALVAGLLESASKRQLRHGDGVDAGACPAPAAVAGRL